MGLFRMSNLIRLTTDCFAVGWNVYKSGSVTLLAGLPLMAGSELAAAAATAVKDNEIGVTASAHSNVERAKEAIDILDSTSGNRVNTVARAANRDRTRPEVDERVEITAALLASADR